MHDEVFGLFEAMSAIEMMDPKMDAGMMCNQIKRKVMTLEKSVEAGTVKIKDLSAEEQIGITDATLACMVTWLEGHSLAQTVFTNLYLHNPYIIEDRCTKAISMCFLKIVDLIRDRINRANVFEEEDFQPMTYGFKMCGDVTDVRVMGMMKEVEDEYNRVLKNTRVKSGEERDAATEKKHELAVAVHTRIRFYRLFLSMLISFTKDKCEGVPQAQKILEQLTELVPIMKKTEPLGIQPEQREVTKNDYPTIMGFEPIINQRLLPPTFPRYTVIKSRSEALSYLEQLADKLKVVCALPSVSSLHSILEIFLDFSKSAPCVLSRSLLQLTFLPPSRKIFGTITVVDAIKDTIRNFIAPPSLIAKSLLYNNPQAKEYVDGFLSHAVRPICTIYQITGHNRARQRDKWAHLMEDMASLQDEADKVDAYLHNILMKTDPSRQHLACFGTWVLYHTLQVMIHYTLSGFELELYATYEYHYVFWYLHELLYAWLASTLTRASSFLSEHEALTEQQTKGRSNKKNKKKKKPKPNGKELLLTQGAQQLCGGYYKALVGFRLDGKMKQPSFEFDSEEVRYTHRFSPFGNVITPPMVQYTQFCEMSDLNRYEFPLSAAEMYSMAYKCFYQAKAIYESISNPSEEVQNLIKIAKTNFVVMKLLMGGHKKDSQSPPEFEFNHSKVFPVIKI
ncbi:N-alpha-acetyltransferase 35, NatC auxiliary subunit-like [Liolophura sinensis]|uniref:N-alpha-acetyltransferase 35, NatC auxiliary subunit-like n=1 Tax=Liolophura sinensis TaxID=3198878 RepID=UPI003158F915